MSDVFTSYSPKDIKEVERVCNYLGKKGLTCRSAKRSGTSDEWAYHIKNAIITSKIFLIFCSRNSIESKEVKYEISIAGKYRNLGKRIIMIPYIIDDVNISQSKIFENYLTSTNRIIAYPDKNDYKLEELYRAIIRKSDIADQRLIDKSVLLKKNKTARMSGIKYCGLNSERSYTGKTNDGSVINEKKTFKYTNEDNKPHDCNVEQYIYGNGRYNIKKCESKDSLILIEKHQSYRKDMDFISVDTHSSNNKAKSTIDNYNIIFCGCECIGTYTGNIDENKKANGKGEFTGIYTDDEGDKYKITYEGEFSNGIITGKGIGTQTIPGKIIICAGEFDNGYLNGQGKSTEEYSHGDIKTKTWEGQFKEDRLYGQGKIIIEYYSGSIKKEIWEGEFQYESLNGRGKITYEYSEGDIKIKTWEGVFTDETLNGQGKITEEYFTGDIKTWEGEFKDSYLNGWGKVTGEYSEGDIKIKTWEGEFEEENLNGQGKITEEYFTGDIKIWEGEFKDSYLNGWGKVTGEYSKGDIKIKTWEGEFTDETLNGQGKATEVYFDGNMKIWKGEFKNNLSNGKTEFIGKFVNGDSENFEGIFINGSANGHGKQIYVYANGEYSISEGEWKDGEMYNGTTINYDKNGNITST